MRHIPPAIGDVVLDLEDLSFTLGLEMATLRKNSMRKWNMPLYCLASLARPRWVSWSILNMLPMRCRPLGPGKYGGLRQKRKIRGRRNRSGVMDCKGCKDCRRESILCVFLLFLFSPFLWV
ncbi:hypothetical protein ACFXTH_027049 [Malus domestica]